ncbi:hypothetical protein ES708_24191 [subsurface metagenome]|jgi:hypothetical protein
MNVTKRKYKPPLKCKICGKRFSYKAKTSPIARLSKHRWKEHRTQAMKSIKGRKSKKSQLDAEQDFADDYLFAEVEKLKQQYAPSKSYEPEHDIAIGALIKGILLGIQAVKAVKARKKKKKGT